WRNSLNLAAENPALGVGPGNWFVHYPRVTTPGDPSFAAADPIPTNPWPSSDWVAMLVERGAPAALLLLLGGVAAAIVALTRILIRPRVTPETPWAGGAEPSSASADDPGLTGPAYRDGALGARPVAMLERLEAEHRERVH